MNRRKWMMLSGAPFAMRRGSAQAPQVRPAAGPSASETAQDNPDTIRLKDYRPRSIYKVPKTEIKRARYPIIDVHCHTARSPEQLDEMVKIMDGVGVQKTVIFTGATTAQRFAEVRQLYAKYSGRFDLWCGFDLTGNDQPGFGPNAVKTLEECHRLGARGVGEISDKGRGIGVGVETGRRYRGRPSAAATEPRPPAGPHADDPRMDALWEKCARLGMPVNLHVSDPIWAYEPMDRTNDGLMNCYTWRLDDKPDLMGHDGLIQSLERAAQKHPKTVFIACHLANLDYDLTRLGQMFERNPNLYADISARFAETAPIPRFVARFFQKHPDRVLYGTDMPYDQRMFNTTFRILETLDEHFYEKDINFNFDYHWPLNGFGLPDAVLRKVYRENALAAFRRAQNSATG